MKSDKKLSVAEALLPSHEDIHTAFVNGGKAVECLIENLIGSLLKIIKELQAQTAMNSGNSSKPPSSDGLGKKPRPGSLREPGKRPNGGQPGHEGHHLKQVREPDHTVFHRIRRCRHCDASLRGTSVSGYERRQVSDVPPVGIGVTEHQAEVRLCPKCGRRSQAEFPAEVSQPAQYGDSLKALAVYFSGYHHIPAERTAEITEDVFGHRVSDAVVIGSDRECAAKAEPANEQIRQQITVSAVSGFDETGMRVGGKTQWLRVACTPALTYHTVHPKRGPEGIRDAGILPEFQGIAVHDHWHPYFSGSDSCSHALCNAHHLRELKSVCEQYGQAWAGELSGLLTEIHREVRKNRPAADVLPACRIAESESRYDRLIEEGMSVNPRSEKISGRRGKQKQSPPRNLPNRLKGKKTEVLRFMYDFRVPFDNNQAERDIRMVRVRQKVSGSFRTQEGANIFSEIRGYVSTAEKNAFSVIEAIQRAFEGNPFVPTPA